MRGKNIFGGINLTVGQVCVRGKVGGVGGMAHGKELIPLKGERASQEDRICCCHEEN